MQTTTPPPTTAEAGSCQLLWDYLRVSEYPHFRSSGRQPDHIWRDICAVRTLLEHAGALPRCNHKFVDSKWCLKCGWVQPPTS